MRKTVGFMDHGWASYLDNSRHTKARDTQGTLSREIISVYTGPSLVELGKGSKTGDGDGDDGVAARIIVHR